MITKYLFPEDYFGEGLSLFFWVSGPNSNLFMWGGEGFPHQQHTILQDTSWVFYNSTQFWHCPPGVRSQTWRACHHRLSHPPNSELCASDQPLQRGGSHKPLLGLARAAHRTKRSIYLLDHQFIVEDYNSETARYKRCIGWGTGKGSELPTLSRLTTLPASPHVHQPGSSPNSIVLRFYENLSTWSWSAKLLDTNDWVNLRLPPFQGGWGPDWKLEPSNHSIGSPGNQSPL